MKKLLLLIVFALSLTMNAQYGCEIMTYGCIHINAYNNTQCVGGTITVTGYVNTNNSSCNNTHWASCRNYNFSVSPNGSGTNTSVTGSTSYFSINITSTVAGTRNYTLNVSNSADLANGIQAGVDNASTSISVTFTNPTTLTIGSITGSSPVCQSQNNVIYTVPVVPNASSYTWTLPSGASGTSSTNSISMNYGANAISGNITVKANFSTCNTTNISTIPVTVIPLLLNAPGAIIGNTCTNTPQNQVTYTVGSMPNVNFYIWTLPNGFVGSSNTNSITVNIGADAVSGNISVKGSNNCGVSPSSSLFVNINSNCAPYLQNIANQSLIVGSPITPITPYNIGGAVYPSGVTTFVGGTAKVNLPKLITTDNNGNLYFADSGNHKIRKITPQTTLNFNSDLSAGYVKTITGTTQGYSDGTGTGQFNDPTGVAIDVNGNLYVADSGNHRIRKITPAGTVSTIVGSTQGYADGTGTAAKFNYPTGIIIDASGNLLVADSGNNRIRKITPSGIVTTFVGSTQGYADGTGVAAQFNTPYSICKDTSGNLYITDANNNRIRKITPTGLVTTLAGSTQGDTDGTGVTAQFNYPTGIAIDETDNLYIADSNNNAIKKITPSGIVTTLAGLNNALLSAQFNFPIGVSVKSSGQDMQIYVTDYNYNRIIKFYPNTPQGNASFITELIPSAQGFADGKTAGVFMNPRAATTDIIGNLYITDSTWGIKKITPAGIISDFIGYYVNPASPTNIIYDSSYGNNGLVFDNVGNLLICNGNKRISKIIPTTNSVSIFAGSVVTGTADGTGISAQFNLPLGICKDTSGNFYVTDTNNNRIRKITPAGLVTTLAGTGIRGSLDGQLNIAQFDSPYSIAIDQRGSIYIGEYSLGSIRRISNGYSIFPDLPAGLSFDSATGVISGIPTTASAATTYTISAYNEYGTATTTVVISIGALGISEFVVNEQLKLYPNPTNSILNLSINDGIKIDKITIVDITGKVILEQTENLSTINVEKLSKGIYIVIAYAGDKKYQEKFIKE
jgi:streptogramin lyase